MELESQQAWVAGADTCTADDIGRLQQLLLSGLLQHAITLLVHRTQLARFVLELLQLVQLRVRIHVADLVVQRQERHW